MLAGAESETGRGRKYEVLRPLAEGGMAELHLARAREPERLVVVKRLRGQLAVDPDFVRMFLDEAHLAMTLRHPNVVEVYEVGEEAGQYYIAMEYLHGHDLRETMARMTERRAAVRIDQALSVARAVAAGLHYTHERTGPDGAQLGIVHRDVSPHNVILTYDGRVKLVDFGIAKTSAQRSRTRTGVLKGKVAYMAPEQAMGQSLDRRSDLFCLGILMWEMTTGRWLYRHRTELETLNAVAQNRPPRPSRLMSDYPRDLEKLVMKTLARSRNDRWANAGELIDAIDELARRRKLTLGSEPVVALTATAFAEELAAWQAVQSFGISLADHLVAQRDRAPSRSSEDDSEVEAEAYNLPPAPALGTTRRERVAHYRRLWPVFGAAIAAGAVAAWLLMRHATPVASGPTVVPGSAAAVSPQQNAASSDALPSGPAHAPSVAVPDRARGPEHAAAPTGSAAPPQEIRSPNSAVRTGKLPAGAEPARSEPGRAAPPPRSSGGRTRPTSPASKREPAAPVVAPPPSTPPVRRPNRPSPEELDKLP